MAYAQPEAHVVDHPRRLGAEPEGAVVRPLVHQGPGDLELVRSRPRDLDADGPHVHRRVLRVLGHGVAATSLRAWSKSEWMRPFEAAMVGAARSSGAPCTAVTVPPASRISSAPAAMSQAPSRCSQ